MNRVIPIQTTPLCDKRWNYSTVILNTKKVQTCCRPPPLVVTDEDIDRLGTDVFVNNDNIRQRRLEMFQGIKHSDCNHCWNDEMVDVPSMRGSSDIGFREYAEVNRLLDEFPGQTIESIKNVITPNSEILYSKTIELLEIKLSNLCDLKCVYCGMYSSSQWALTMFKRGEIDSNTFKEITNQKIDSKFENTFWEWMDTVAIKTLQHINIKGGEPLLTPEIFKFFDRVIELSEKHNIPNKAITIHIITNLNASDIILDKFIGYLEKLNKHFKLEMILSIEAIGKKAEFIRDGLNWNQFEKNANRLAALGETKLTLSFMPTINMLCIASLPEFIKWVVELSNRHNCKLSKLYENRVFWPDYLSPMYLPSEFSKYIANAISIAKNDTLNKEVWNKFNLFLNGIKETIESDNNRGIDVEEAKKNLIKFISENENFYQLFPEYKSVV